MRASFSRAMASRDEVSRDEPSTRGVVASAGVTAAITGPRVRTDRHGIARGLQIVGNGLIFIKADHARVGAHEAFVENPSGQLVKFFFFERLQHARADLRGRRDLFQRHVALFALELEFFAEGGQTSLL